MALDNPTIGEIVMFAGNFVPRSWAFCDGQLLSISEHTALFSIIGTTYGGDGRTTFGLPDLRGRVPIHVGGNGSSGRGPGLSAYRIGERNGQEEVTLNVLEMPTHNHPSQLSGISASMKASTTEATSAQPGPTSYPASSKAIGAPIYNSDPNTTIGVDVSSTGLTIGNNGGNRPHNNMQPYLAINYIIALTGIFPTRS